MQTALKVLGFLLAGFLGLVVVAYLAIAGGAALDARGNKQDAVAEAERALPEARAAANEQHDRLRTTAGGAEAGWSWTEVTCRWNTREGGWIVTTYAQECQLQVVDLVPADPAPGADCVDREAELRQRGEVTSTVMRGPSTSLGRAWTYDLGCPNDVVLHERDGPRVVLEGERPDDLTDAPAWTILRTTTPLSSTDVGCHRWSVIFCDRPGDLALPES